ncbi:fibrous sheath CABYR-binding protein-like [Drosophila albomicans]|uniref:Fibrous sheath CABYR-binding protein-like n=1 Tax=Drosophila albomicans TaxID=7291 RepID=A0A9C6WEE6_DROAB|nr:fibrous sheath CABYR-binding protein-like [Drosophila albomicans]
MESIDLTCSSPPRDYAGDAPPMTPDRAEQRYSSYPHPQGESPEKGESLYTPWDKDDPFYLAGLPARYDFTSEGESEERPYEEDDESKQEESSEAEEPRFRLPPGAWSPRPGQRRDPRLGHGLYARPPSPTETEVQRYRPPPTEDSDTDEPFFIEEVDRTVTYEPAIRPWGMRVTRIDRAVVDVILPPGETLTSYFELPEHWNYRGPAIADRPVPPPYFPPAFRRPTTPVLRRLEEMDMSDPDGFPLPKSSYDPPQEGPRWESASSDDEPDGPRFRRQYPRTSPANEESDSLDDLLEVLGQDLVPLQEEEEKPLMTEVAQESELVEAPAEWKVETPQRQLPRGLVEEVRCSEGRGTRTRFTHTFLDTTYQVNRTKTGRIRIFIRPAGKGGV